MKTIAYCNLFISPEWIAAHGFEPRRLLLRSVARNSSYSALRGVCPFAAAAIEAVDDSMATVLTSTCDQMRYAAALLTHRGAASVFLLNVPSTWKTASSRELYRSELERLGRFLVALGGGAATNDALAEIMSKRDAGVRSVGENDAETFSSVGIPLAVVGGPFTDDADRFFACVEKAGGRIVLNATEGSSLLGPREFDLEKMKSDPFGELVDAYFDGIADPFRRPNDIFYERLERGVLEANVRGVILRRYVWCDIWHAEFRRICEILGVPTLEIDVAADGAGEENRMQGRIEAFMESLR